MTEIYDSLERRYGGVTAKPLISKSWIPNRPHSSDPQEKLRRQINKNLEEADKTINNTELLTEIKNDIFEQVEAYLLEEHGDEVYKQKMDHFQNSWEKFYCRYGNVLILALGELTDEIEFLNHEGYIDKYKAGKQIESVKKRLGIQ